MPEQEAINGEMVPSTEREPVFIICGPHIEPDLREIHGQRIVDRDNGDCLRACMSYVLGIRNDDRLLNEHSMALIAWDNWLFDYGLGLRWDHKACWVSGLWIASVPSKNYDDRTHAIVMCDNKVEFDPSPGRRYHAGWSLLGKDVVLGGYQIVVRDPRLLDIGIGSL